MPPLHTVHSWGEVLAQLELLPYWSSHCDLGKWLLPVALDLLICAVGILPGDASPACFSLKPQAGPVWTKGALAIIVHLSVSGRQACAASSQHVHMLASTQ